MVERHPVPAGARTLRRQTPRLAAVLLAAVLLLADWAAPATAAPWSDPTQNGVNRLRADTLAPPGTLVPLRTSAAAGMTRLSWAAADPYAATTLERATSPTGPFTPIARLAPETAGFTEFPVTAGTRPYGITNGPDGALWFTARDSNQIGRITTSGSTTFYPIPTANSQPETIVAGPDGALWFTETGANKIGRIAVDGTISEYAVPTPGSVPKGITAGGDGHLYFTQQATGGVARIATDGTITEFATLPPGSQSPHDIAWGPDGKLWLTNGGTDGLAQVTTAGTVTGLPVPTASSGPAGIAVGPTGDLWFAETTGSRIGRFSPYYDSFAATEFPLTAGRAPLDITAGADGNMWFTARDGNRIGRITAAGAVTEFAVPTANSAPTSIATGPDGAVWFTQPGTNAIGRYALGLTTSFTDTTAIPAQAYHYRGRRTYKTWTSTQGATNLSLSMAPASAGDSTGAGGALTALTAPDVATLGRADNTPYTTAGDWRTHWTLRGVDTRDGVRIWAVGDGGLMALSTDGGATWTQQPSATTADLKRISFVDATTGWAVGAGGTILSTIDGGGTWSTQASGTTVTLRDVTLLDATTGWVAGDAGTILFWNGTSWAAQAAGTTENLRGVAAGSTTRAWAVGDRGTVQTWDGTSWSNFEINGRPPLHDVVAVDATHAWVVGDTGRVFYVDGPTELLKNHNPQTSQHLYAVAAVGTSVWVGGANGAISRYNGSTWTAQTSGTTASITGLAFASASTGHYVTAGARPGRTTDGGQTWIRPLTKSVELTLPAAAAPSGAVLNRVRATFVYRTSAVPSADAAFSVQASFDGGATWTSQSLSRPTSTGTVTQTVDFNPALTSLAALQAHGIRLSFRVTSSNVFTTAHDTVHVDVN